MIKRLGTSVRGLDSSVIGHRAFPHGVFAFVYSLSISGEFIFISLAFSLQGKFCPFLARFEMPHFVCLHLSKLDLHIDILIVSYLVLRLAVFL